MGAQKVSSEPHWPTKGSQLSSTGLTDVFAVISLWGGGFLYRFSLASQQGTYWRNQALTDYCLNTNFDQESI